METFTLFVTGFSMIGLVLGIFGCFFKALRPKASVIAGWCLIFFIGSVVYAVVKSDDWAKEAGFLDAADKRAAEAANVKVPEEWNKRNEAAQAAGFTDYAMQQQAAAEGVQSSQEWKERLVEKEKEKRLERIKVISKSIQSAEEISMANNGLKLFLKIETAGLDGGASDFFSFADTIGRVSASLREEPTKYTDLQIKLFVPTVDKYGNSSPTADGSISWKVSELDKVNLKATPDFILQVAHEVSLGRFGREMARAFCKKWDFRDPRYCR